MQFINEVANTLYIPLTMKALESRKSEGLFKDAEAEKLVEQLAIPLPAMDMMQQGTQLGTAVRVKILDDRLADFIRRHPDAVLVTIGCGLDNRLARINALHTAALNIDLQEVIDLRINYVTEASSLVENKAFSVFEDQWIDFLRQKYANRPKILIAEGVLMYFSEQQVMQLIEKIIGHFAGSEFWFDSASQAANDLLNQREDFKKLQVSSKWALDDAASLNRANFQLIESLAMMECFPHIWGYMLQKAPEPFKQGSRINGFRVG